MNPIDRAILDQRNARALANKSVEKAQQLGPDLKFKQELAELRARNKEELAHLAQRQEIMRELSIANSSRDAGEIVKDTTFGLAGKGALALGKMGYGFADLSSRYNLFTAIDATQNYFKNGEFDAVNIPSLNEYLTDEEGNSPVTAFDEVREKLSNSQSDKMKAQRAVVSRRAQQREAMAEERDPERGTLSKISDTLGDYASALSDQFEMGTQLTDTILESAPQMLVPGGIAKSGLGMAAKATTKTATKNLMKKGVKKEAAEIISKNNYAKMLTTKEGKAFAEKVAERSGVGFTIVAEGMSNGLDVQAEVLKTSYTELEKTSPKFNEYVRDGISPRDARRKLADEAMAITSLYAGVFGGVVSKYSGAGKLEGKGFKVGPLAKDGKLAAVASKVPFRKTATGAIKEGVEETLQEGGGTAFSNYAKKKTVDPTQDVWEGVVDAAAAGTAAGIGSGGAMTGVANIPGGALDVAAAGVKGAQAVSRKADQRSAHTPEARKAAKSGDTSKVYAKDADGNFTSPVDAVAYSLNSDKRRQSSDPKVFDEYVSEVEKAVAMNVNAMMEGTLTKDEEKVVTTQMDAVDKLRSEQRNRQKPEVDAFFSKAPGKDVDANAIAKAANYVKHTPVETEKGAEVLMQRIDDLLKMDLDDGLREDLTNQREVVKSFAEVSHEVFNGDNRKTPGINIHRERVNRAVDAGNKAGAENAQRRFELFANNHKNRLATLQTAWKAFEKISLKNPRENLSEEDQAAIAAAEKLFSLGKDKNGNRNTWKMTGGTKSVINGIAKEVKAMEAANTEMKGRISRMGTSNASSNTNTSQTSNDTSTESTATPTPKENTRETTTRYTDEMAEQYSGSESSGLYADQETSTTKPKETSTTEKPEFLVGDEVQKQATANKNKNNKNKTTSTKNQLREPITTNESDSADVWYEKAKVAAKALNRGVNPNAAKKENRNKLNSMKHFKGLIDEYNKTVQGNQQEQTQPVEDDTEVPWHTDENPRPVDTPDANTSEAKSDSSKADESVASDNVQSRKETEHEGSREAPTPTTKNITEEEHKKLEADAKLHAELAGETNNKEESGMTDREAQVNAHYNTVVTHYGKLISAAKKLGVKFPKVTKQNFTDSKTQKAITEAVRAMQVAEQKQLLRKEFADLVKEAEEFNMHVSDKSKETVANEETSLQKLTDLVGKLRDRLNKGDIRKSLFREGPDISERTNKKGKLVPGQKNPLKQFFKWIRNTANNLLVESPNAISKVREELNRDDISDSRRASLERLLEFHDKFVKEFLQNIILKQPAFTGQDSIAFLFKGTPKDPTNITAEDIHPNVLAALSMGAMNWLVNHGSSTLFNDEQAIKTILEDTSKRPLDGYKYKIFKRLGTAMFGSPRQSIGPNVLQALGIEARDDTPGDIAENLPNSITNHVMLTLSHMGMVEFTTMPYEALEALKDGYFKDDNGNPIESSDSIVKQIKEKFPDNKPENYDTVTFVKVKHQDETNEDGFTYPVPAKRQKEKNVLAVGDYMEAAKEVADVLESMATERDNTKRPSLKKPENKSDNVADIRGTTQKTPEAMKEKLAKEQTYTYKINTMMRDALSSLGEALFLRAAGYDPDYLTTKHVSEHEGIEARNESILLDLENFKEFSEEAGDNPFWFMKYVMKNHRMGIAANTIDPQASKFHRQMVGLEEHIEEIDPSDKKQENNFLRAVAVSFGIKTETMSHAKAMKELRAKLNTKEMKAAMEAIRNGEITAENQEAILAGVEKGGEALHSLAGLLEYVAFRDAKAKGKSYTTRLQRAPDGVTNGTAIALLQFVSNVPDTIRRLKRVGIYTGAKETFNKWASKAGSLDAYRDIAKKWNEGLKDLLKTFESEGNVYFIPGSIEDKYTKKITYDSRQGRKGLARTFKSIGLLVGRLVDDEGIVTKLGRDLSKDPLMTSNYGAGMKKILENFASDRIENLYQEIAKASQEGDTKRIKELISYVNVTLGVHGIAIDPQFVIDNPLSWELTYNQENALHNNFVNVYGAPLEIAMKEEYGDIMNRRKTMNEAMKIAYSGFKLLYDQKHAELQKSLNGNMPSAVQLRELNESLLDAMPIFKSVFSANNSEGIMAMKKSERANRVGTYSKANSQSHKGFAPNKVSLVNPGRRNLKGKVRKSTSLFAQEPSWIDGGVSSPINAIQNIDSAVMLTMLENHVATNIHDAALLSVLKAEEGIHALNEGFYNINKDHSVFTESYVAFARTINYLQDNHKDLINVLAKKVVSEKMSVPEGERDGRTLREFTELFKSAEAANTAAREELFSYIKQVHQYTDGPGGNYETGNTKTYTEPKSAPRIEKSTAKTNKNGNTRKKEKGRYTEQEKKENTAKESGKQAQQKDAEGLKKNSEEKEKQAQEQSEKASPAVQEEMNLINEFFDAIESFADISTLHFRGGKSSLLDALKKRGHSADNLKIWGDLFTKAATAIKGKNFDSVQKLLNTVSNLEGMNEEAARHMVKHILAVHLNRSPFVKTEGTQNTETTTKETTTKPVQKKTESTKEPVKQNHLRGLIAAAKLNAERTKNPEEGSRYRKIMQDVEQLLLLLSDEENSNLSRKELSDKAVSLGVLTEESSTQLFTLLDNAISKEPIAEATQEKRANDPKIHKAIKDGKSIKEILNLIREGQEYTRVQRVIAKVLGKLLGNNTDVRIFIYDENTVANEDGLSQAHIDHIEANPTYGMFWQEQNNVIALNDFGVFTGVNPETFLHEVTHALTKRIINSAEGSLTEAQENARKKLYALLEKVKEADTEGKWASQTENMDEFITYAWTNPAFQEHLKTIKTGKKSGWRTFIESVAEAFGLSENTHNALSDIIDLTGDLFELNVPDNTNPQQDMFGSTQDTGFTESFDGVEGKEVTARTSKEIFEELGTDDIVADTQEHETRLRGLLDNLINKVVESTTLYMRSKGTENKGAYDYRNGRIYMDNGLPNQASAFGTMMSQRETYVHELLHAILHAAIDGDNLAARTLRKYYLEIRDAVDADGNKWFTAKDFLQNPDIQPTDSNYAQEMELAQERYDYVFGNNVGTHSGKVYNPVTEQWMTKTLSNGHHEFMTMALSNAAMIAKLKKYNSEVKNVSPKDASWVDKFTTWVKNVFEHFANKALYGKEGGASFDRKMLLLAHQLAGVDARNVSQIQNVLEQGGAFIQTAFDKTIEVILAPIKGVLRSGVVQDSSSKIVKTAASTIQALPYFDKVVDGIKTSMEAYGGATDGFISSIYNELRGPTPRSMYLQDLNRERQHFIDKTRLKAFDHTSKYIKNSFLSEYTKEKAKALSSLVTTDLDGIFQENEDGDVVYDGDYLEKLYLDDSFRDKEIIKLINQITREFGDNSTDRPISSDVSRYYISMAKNMGYYMATGETQQNVLINNTDIIADMDNTGIERPDNSEDAKALIDKLATLTAIQHTQESVRNTVGNTIKAEFALNPEENGILATLGYHRAMKAVIKEHLFKGSEKLIEKGYTKETFSPNKTFTVAPGSYEQDLLKQGYTKGRKVKKDRHDENSVPMFIYIANKPPEGKFQAGSISMTGRRHKGPDLTKMARQRGEQEPGLIAAQLRPQLIAAKQKALNNIAKGRPEGVRDDEGVMAPIFNRHGEMVDFAYRMNEATKRDILKKDTSLHTALGKTTASFYDKHNTVPMNRKIIQEVYNYYQEHGRSSTKGFIAVGPRSPDPKYREIYQMLPEEAKQDIRNIWGQEHMWIKAEDASFVLGERELMLSGLTHKERLASDSPLVSMGKVINNTAAYVLNRPKIRLVEALTKEVISMAKDAIVIKSGVVLWANQISNMVLLRTMGVPIIDIFKYQGEALIELRRHRRDTNELEKLKFEITAYPKKEAQLRGRIVQLEDSLSKNKVSPLIDAGMFQHIVEDVDFMNQDSNQSMITEWLDNNKAIKKVSDKTPNIIKTVAKNVAMTHDTGIYQFMRDMTQASDFIARYALHEHNKKHHADTMTSKQSIDLITRVFINYAHPTHKYLQYANDMGFFMFSKFFLRIQGVILYLAQTRPGSVAALMIGQNLFGDVDNVFQTLMTPDAIGIRMTTPVNVAEQIMTIPMPITGMGKLF